MTGDTTTLAEAIEALLKSLAGFGFFMAGSICIFKAFSLAVKGKLESAKLALLFSIALGVLGILSKI